MAKAVHSKIGASTCERWWNCPGSVRLAASIPPQPSSPYADEGTVAHLVGEWCLGTGRDAVEYVGQKALQLKTKDGEIRFEFKEDARLCKGATLTGKEIEVTDEMAEAVQMYLDTIRFDMATYGLTVDDIKIEHRFHLVHVDEDAYGTNDCNLPVFLDKVIVYDYKHGQGVAVDAEENKQLLYYALGAADLGDYDTIEVVIIQPRAIHAHGPIRRWTISAAELSAFGIELKEHIEATRDPKASLVCGPWCKKTFCPAMAVCPAIKGQVSQDAMIAFGEPTQQVTLPKPEELTPVQLQRILDGMELVETWLTSIYAYAQQKANNGEKVLGYKLVRGREGNRKWMDEQTAVNILGPDIFEKRVISVAQAEKKLKDKKDKIAGLVTRSEGKIILAPESDPREEVTANITEVFGAIE